MDIFFWKLAEFFSVFYHSTFFSVIKLFLGVYVTVLFIDLVLLLIFGWKYNVHVTFKGMEIPLSSKKGMRKKWEKITDRLKSNNPSQYKAAILEGDALINEILDEMGVAGQNMMEKIESLKSEQIFNLKEDLKQAHLIRNKIIYEKDFFMEKEKAKEVLGVFEKFIKYLDLI